MFKAENTDGKLEMIEKKKEKTTKVWELIYYMNFGISLKLKSTLYIPRNYGAFFAYAHVN